RPETVSALHQRHQRNERPDRRGVFEVQHAGHGPKVGTVWSISEVSELRSDAGCGTTGRIRWGERPGRWRRARGRGRTGSVRAVRQADAVEARSFWSIPRLHGLSRMPEYSQDWKEWSRRAGAGAARRKVSGRWSAASEAFRTIRRIHFLFELSEV